MESFCSLARVICGLFRAGMSRHKTRNKKLYYKFVLCFFSYKKKTFSYLWEEGEEAY
jgi:hypothetical protein